MDVFDGVPEEAARNLRGAGADAVRELLWRTYLRYGRTLESDPVFEADWDLLVVLDACRADLWASVVDGDTFPVGSSRISPGGTSTEWLSATFGEADPATLSAVGYVTANPYSEAHVDGSALGHLDEVWRDGWSDDLGTTPPRPVTDAAIRAGRETAASRLVVHYMQPHFPPVAGEWAGRDGMELATFGDEGLSVWEDLRFGRRSTADAWAASRRNLVAVLEDVRLLLRNVDADRVVVTADHGNAFGERYLWGHAGGLALRALREVPWAVTTATDEHTHAPDGPDRSAVDDVDADVERRLRDLGYR